MHTVPMAVDAEASGIARCRAPIALGHGVVRIGLPAPRDRLGRPEAA